jgi:hypothetical protein
MQLWKLFEDWGGLLPRSPSHALVEPGRRRVPTEYSATVFTGESEEWVSYLKRNREDRYLPARRIAIEWEPSNEFLRFRPLDAFAEKLAACLNAGYAAAEERARAKPFVRDTLRDLVFGNSSNGLTDLFIRVSPDLPSEGSREVLVDSSLAAVQTNIVLQKALVDQVLSSIGEATHESTSDDSLGLGWPILRRVLSQLGYSSYPRDRYVEKIDLVERLCLLSVNFLYEGKRDGVLVPNKAGALFQEYVCRRDEISAQHLFDRHPYFRLLNELSFVLDERRYRAYQTDAKVLVREYLDERYLRLSLAGIMPDVAEVMQPMPYRWRKGRVRTQRPRLGRYGILDEDDLAAWKKVAPKFDDLGFALLRQLGMGEFGRVYEAVNCGNPRIPQRVALKVDRILKGQKKKAIQAAEVTMQIGRDLSPSPHVIRVFDAGKLKGIRYTYHVLQLVDGDTLDNLVGVTGTEHSSVHRPHAGWSSEKHIHGEYLKAMRRSAGESWRRRHLALPFTAAPSLAQLLDLLTSILLWIEEVHGLGYAANDLKNGNLMVSRRGQMKGIDLDSYTVIGSTMERMTDFFFLAPSILLLVLGTLSAKQRKKFTHIDAEALLGKPDSLRATMQQAWPFGDVRTISNGRVRSEDVIDSLIRWVSRSRDRTYLDDPDRFSADIDQLIHLKRSIFMEEIVLD